MFIQPKPAPLPKGAKRTWAVRYPKGRKPFDKKAEADAFHNEQLAAEGGWAETVEVVETIVRKRA